MNKTVVSNIHRGIAALALSFSFMFFVYAPLEVFLGNTTEFWFDITHLVPLIIISFLISSTVLILVLELLYKFVYSKNKRAFYIIYTVMFMSFVGLYIQGNYIPRNYGVLDGSTIDWKSYKTYGIISAVLWGSIIATGIVLWIKLRKHMFKIGQGVSTAIFIMLTTALISLIPKAEQIIDKNTIVVTDKDQWVLSKNKNIYVLVLDTFDSEYMRVLLKENDKKYSDVLTDFTYYSNSVGGYPTTRASLPLILTGEWYENDIKYNNYISKTYDRNLELYEQLRANDYSIGVYTYSMFLSKEEGFYSNVNLGKYRIDSPLRFAKTLYKLIAFEYVPQHLKSFFAINTGDFEEEKIFADSRIANVSAYSMSDAKYYKRLNNRGFELSEDSNYFKVIHLEGMHPPYDFGEEVVEDGKDYTYLEASKGNLSEIEALIDNLKEKGIYDNTAIMILADHGGGTLASEMNCNPLLLIKGFDEHHDFNISEMPISWDDIYPTLTSWASGIDKQNAVWNINDENRERRFLNYSWDDSWGGDYLPTMVEYSVTGNVSDKTVLLQQTGHQYIPGAAALSNVEGLALKSNSRQNLLGEEVNRIEVPVDPSSEAFRTMYVTGLGKVATNDKGQNYAWSEGYYTYFKLNPEGEQKLPYSFTMNFSEIYNPDDMNVSDVDLMHIYATVNGERLSTCFFTDSSMTFTIPEEALNEDTVDVMIFYPYAKPRKGSKESNALAVTSIVLEQKIPTRIGDKFIVDFSENGNFKDIVSSGWSGAGQEKIGVWTKEAAKLIFISDNDSDFIMSIKYNALVADIPTVVKLNGHEICTLSQENAKKIILPKEYLKESFQELEFVTEGAVTPKEAGINTDTRTLGIYVNSITITESKVNFPVDISFQSEIDSAAPCIISGFGDAEQWGAWSIGNEAVLSFYIPEVQNDLLMTMGYSTYHKQNISIYANDVLLDAYEFEGLDHKELVIPKECITDNELIIRFDLPTASSPKQNGESEDDRVIAIGMTSLLIQEMKR